jgi:hypothetical protein
MSRTGLAVAAPAMLAAVVACSPALDWREVRPQGSGLRAALPCRPAGHARELLLAGATVEMTMLACSAGDVTYALAFADVRNPAQVTPALVELALASQSHLQPAATAVSLPLAVPGMTPNPQALRWRLSGRLPDGRAIDEQMAVFVQGTTVYQATMLGSALDAQAQDNFFGALRLGR